MVYLKTVYCGRGLFREQTLFYSPSIFIQLRLYQILYIILKILNPQNMVHTSGFSIYLYVCH